MFDVGILSDIYPLTIKKKENIETLLKLESPHSLHIAAESRTSALHLAFFSLVFRISLLLLH